LIDQEKKFSHFGSKIMESDKNVESIRGRKLETQPVYVEAKN
jgi:hypothetical protein